MDKSVSFNLNTRAERRSKVNLKGGTSSAAPAEHASFGTIGDLPTDILETIFEKLSAPDLLKASHVSRVWRRTTERSIKSLCANDGLKIPEVGVKTLWEVQAHAIRAKKALRWGDRIMPSFCIDSPSLDCTAFSFPSNAIQVTETGVLSRGNEVMSIDLPPLGSDARIRINVMPFDKNCIQLSSGRFVVSHDGRLKILNSDGDLTQPVAVAPLGTFALCVAEGPNTLATGHADGIRLWTKDTLQQVKYLSTDCGVKKIALSSDGSFLLTANQWRKTCLWNLSCGDVFDLADCDHFFFDETRRQVACCDQFTNISFFDMKGIFKGKLHSPKDYSAAFFSPLHRSFIFVGWDHEVYVVEDADVRIYPPFTDYGVESLATTKDGRWLVELLETGGIRLRDLSWSRSRSHAPNTIPLSGSTALAHP